MNETRLADGVSALVGDVVTICLQYPRNSQHKSIEIDLEDVRAADNIRVSYDFDRDGWKIEQDKKAHLDGIDEEWVEVSFIQAWQFEDKDTRSFER